MRGWRQRERQQMRDGHGRQEGEGKDRKEGKRIPSCKSPVHCCKWGGGKKHPPQNFKDNIETILVPHHHTVIT